MAEASGFVVAAPSSGSGKTLVTLGLIGALRAKGLRVAAAKAGPDYIDPRFHEAASGAPAVNLDPWAMRPDLVAGLAGEVASGADLFVVEGVMGLFDGSESGDGSTADLAALLGLPVILVVDAGSQAQSAAALVKGFAEFRADTRISGVVFNRVASPRHGALLRGAVEALGIPVLGTVARASDLALPSRHLGLIQAGEHPDLARFVDAAAALVTEGCDLDALARAAAPVVRCAPPLRMAPLGQRIAVADDVAFGFSYPHLLGGWRAVGAEIVPFSPLADEAPDPNADAVFLPGGYPELHAGRLAAAAAFKAGLAGLADRGALIYGECGGFMVLGDAIVDGGGARHAMAGLLPVTTSFARRKLTLGYRRLTHRSPLPWPAVLRGHEFHYSVLDSQGPGASLFEAEDASGRTSVAIGLQRGKVMGSYAHVIDQEGV